MPDNHNIAQTRPGNPVPREGENGLFTQSWFPLCYSDELAPGQVLGKPFLDGRVVIYRTGDGRAIVTSAYCPHLGIDLQHGRVVDDRLQCVFHQWEYDETGRCVKTGIGDPPPKSACLFRFPTVEKYGVIFAFNGERAEWDVPDLALPEARFVIRTAPKQQVNCDPWVMAANTPDIQHFKLLHQFDMDVDAARASIEWQPNSLRYTMTVGVSGNLYRFEPNVHGTSVFFVNGELLDGEHRGRRFGLMAPFGLPAPGQCEIFTAVMVEKGDGSPADNAVIDTIFGQLQQRFGKMVSEDLPLVDSGHYRPGALTQADSELGRYLQLVRRYPRGHASRAFIH